MPLECILSECSKSGQKELFFEENRANTIKEPSHYDEISSMENEKLLYRLQTS